MEWSVSSIIMMIMAVFFVLGALDRLFGNRIGLGSEFTRGFYLMGPTGLSVLGLMAFAPVLARGINYVLSPIFNSFGADVSSLIGSVLSCDVGYPVAKELAQDFLVGEFNGLIVGSTIGYIVSFAIPLACGLVKPEHYRYFAVGILSGYIFDPVGCFIGGLMIGLPPKTLILNLIAPILIAALIAIGLLFAPAVTMKVFKWVSRIIMAAVTVGLCAAAFEKMTGIVVIPGMNPITDGFKTLGTIVLSLAGSLPFLWTIKKVFGKPINSLGERLGINDTSVLCIILAITSLVPGYTDFEKMNGKGRVVFAAFSASAGCMFGAHLGFTSAVDTAVVVPMLISKVIAGVMGVLTACFFYSRLIKE